jgi:hypothetical protein
MKLSLSAGLLILLSLFAVSTVTAQSPADDMLSDTQLATGEKECINCILSVPECKGGCPAGSICKIVPQTCERCSYAYCAKLRPPRPIRPRPPKRACPPPKPRPTKPREEEGEGKCVQCLWKPTCAATLCEMGTVCVEIEPTCHSCGSVQCVKK